MTNFIGGSDPSQQNGMLCNYTPDDELDSRPEYPDFDKGWSNCCGARMINGTCVDCKEPAEPDNETI